MSVFLEIKGNYFKARTDSNPIVYIDNLLSGISISLIDDSDDSFSFYYNNQPIQYLQNVSINDILAENGTDFTDLASFIVWKDTFTGSVESGAVNDLTSRVETNELDIDSLELGLIGKENQRDTEKTVKNITELLELYPANVNNEIVIPTKTALVIDSSEFDLGIYTLLMSSNTTLSGVSQNFSYIFSSEDNHTLIKGDGSQFITHIKLGATGSSSKVFDLVGVTGFEALDLFYTEFESGSTLGDINGIRQGFWTTGFGINSGRGFLLKGSWLGGFTIFSTRIINCGEYLLKGDVGFTCSNIRSNVNITVPSGAFAFDFDYDMFNVDNGYQINGANVDGDGLMCAPFTTGDTTIPENSIKSYFKNNTGDKGENTFVGGQWQCTTQVETIIPDPNVEVKLQGVTTYNSMVHFTQTTDNSLIYNSSVKRRFNVGGNIVLDGGANDNIKLTVKKYNNLTSLYEDVYSYTKTVNNIIGGADRVEFSISTNVSMNYLDRLELFASNLSDGTNVTMLLTSQLIIDE